MVFVYQRVYFHCTFFIFFFLLSVFCTSNSNFRNSSSDLNKTNCMITFTAVAFLRNKLPSRKRSMFNFIILKSEFFFFFVMFIHYFLTFFFILPVRPADVTASVGSSESTLGAAQPLCASVICGGQKAAQPFPRTPLKKKKKTLTEAVCCRFQRGPRLDAAAASLTRAAVLVTAAARMPPPSFPPFPSALLAHKLSLNACAYETACVASPPFMWRELTGTWKANRESATTWPAM